MPELEAKKSLKFENLASLSKEISNLKAVTESLKKENDELKIINQQIAKDFLGLQKSLADLVAELNGEKV